MNGMTGDYYEVWLDTLGRTSRPQFRALLLARAGVELDADLAQYLVLLDMRGPTGVLELAELLGHNHPKASRSLARLEQLGLVSRGEAAHDRRIKTAAATIAGHQLVAAINDGRRRLLDDAFAGWSDRDRAQFARLSRRFAAAISALIGTEGVERNGS